MSHPKARPVIIFALIQLGVVFAGILGAGVAERLTRELTGMPPRPLTLFVLNHGIWLGFIPLVWTGVTLTVLHSRRTGAFVESLLVFGGVALAVGLGVLMCFAIVH